MIRRYRPISASSPHRTTSRLPSTPRLWAMAQLSASPPIPPSSVRCTYCSSLREIRMRISSARWSWSRGARVMLIESYEGAGGDYQVNSALELFVADEAHVDHVKIVGEGKDALHVSTLAVAIGAKARFNAFNFVTGGAVVRNQLFVNFDGENTVANIRGATLIKGRQHADVTLVAQHGAPGCQSREVFKSVLDNEAHGVFQGRIIVRPGAQQTDAKMMTRALLLSENAEADSKPELEIFADDVQCGHGATAGAIDDELKFYLMARGIPPSEAEALLIQAFLGEAVEGIEHAGLREALMEQVAAWLKARSRRPHERCRHQRLLRRQPHPRGLSDPRHPGLRQAARLSRQRRLGAKAQAGARPHSASLHDAICQRASRAALSRQRGDRGLRGRAGEGRGVPERQPQGRGHFHPQRHRGDQPRRLYFRPRPHQSR